MKKLLLTAVTAFTLLFAQAQCQADFSYTQNGPMTVFTDMSTINAGWSTNYSVTWEWDFGDGTISTQQNPVHTYANNGIYSPCLTVFYFDSVIINYCISVSCDSLFIGNSLPASWDCNPVNGCFDPGTGSGQYTSLSACQSACTVTPSWDCNPNMLGCFDPGTGLGQYTSLSACQTACSVTASWECDQVNGCYDPGTGLGQYTTLAACQAVCSNTTSVYCDSMIANGSQTQSVFEIIGLNIPVDYWISTANDGTVLGEDSMSTYHIVDNSFTIPNDTINVCITYADAIGYYTCCVTWVWDAASGMWAKMGGVTSLGEINSDNKKLIKIVDVLGRETFPKNNEILFYIYGDGTIDKRYIKE